MITLNFRGDSLLMHKHVQLFSRLIERFEVVEINQMAVFYVLLLLTISWYLSSDKTGACIIRRAIGPFRDKDYCRAPVCK